MRPLKMSFATTVTQLLDFDYIDNIPAPAAMSMLR